MPQHTIVHPVVGQVSWQADVELAGRPIKLLNNFERDNIVTVFIPQLKGVKDNTVDNATHPFDGRLSFYKMAVGQLKAAFAEIESKGLLNRIVSCAGSFNPRLKQRKNHDAFVDDPSNHAFGTAFDINNEFNKQGDAPRPAGSPGSVVELVPIFKKHGFKWGGDFTPTPDGMHFEVATLIASPPVTLTEIKVIKPHLNNVVVGAIQQKLLDAGFDPQGVDNKYGTHTEDAVKAFQAAKSLPVTGIVDKVTAGVLGVVFPFVLK